MLWPRKRGWRNEARFESRENGIGMTTTANSLLETATSRYEFFFPNHTDDMQLYLRIECCSYSDNYRPLVVGSRQNEVAPFNSKADCC